ncbi:MAG: hypothetical protein GVY10_05490 [Verrucomicrobia bacterium]|nr:hypothetical protein [Verrucomicrobiota bacterium]
MPRRPHASGAVPGGGRGGFRLGSGIKLFGTAKNLLAREYVVSGHPHGARAGSPRQVLGGVRWRF